MRAAEAGEGRLGQHDDYGELAAGSAMTKLKDLKARFMEDPEFRKEYARADKEYALVEAKCRPPAPCCAATPKP